MGRRGVSQNAGVLVVLVNIEISNSSIVTKNGFSTAVDRGSKMATGHRMSMMVYCSFLDKFVRT